MARIRTIKPDFWKDEKIMDCKPLERLLFIGLWNFVDDYGRMIFAPRTIRADIFPEDGLSASDINDMLMTLSSKGMITIYTNKDKTYLAVTNWDKHQRIDNKAKPRIPGPFDDNSSEETQILASPSEQSEKIGLEREGEKEKEENIPTVAKATRRDEQFEEFWKAYPRRDGANPKSPAEKLFLAAVKGGEPPENIIRGARVCATLEQKHVGTPFIPQAVKWLRDKRWRDYQEPIAVKLVTDWDAICSSFKKFGHWSKWEGPPPGSVGCRCPVEILHKHGIEFLKMEATP